MPFPRNMPLTPQNVLPNACAMLEEANGHRVKYNLSILIERVATKL